MRHRTWLAAAFVAVFPLTASSQDFRRTVPVEPPGSLHVHLAQGSIEVESHDKHEVRIEASAEGWRSRNVEFELRQEGNDVTFESSAAGWLQWGRGDVEVHIRVPNAYSVDLRTAGGDIQVEEIVGAVSARTSGGSIELDQIEGPVELHTSGGPIRAEEIHGDLEAETSGGPIEVSEASGRVNVRTSGGRLELLDVAGPVRARTSGGSIAARLLEAVEGHFETSGGNIELVLPRGGAWSLDARTSGGRVEISEDLPWSGVRETSRVDGQINGGGPSLRLKTSGGNIEIESR